MNMARIESHPGLFGNPYMDTKSKTHEANPQKGFVVQINASENFGLTTWTRDTESRAGVQGLTHRILLRPAFFSANRHGSSWHVRGNCPPPIHCLDEQCELRRRQNHLTVHDRRPDKLAALEALVTQFGMQALRLPRSSLLL